MAEVATCAYLVTLTRAFLKWDSVLAENWNSSKMPRRGDVEARVFYSRFREPCH